MSISQEQLGRRLNEARKASRMSQQAVADRLEFSRSTLAQIELGNRSVSGLELGKLAYLYGRDMKDFLVEVFQKEDTLVAIFRSQPDVSDEEAVLEALRECMALGRELTNLERHLEIDRDASAVVAYSVKPPENPWGAIKQGEQIANEERRRLGLGVVPVPDISGLLETQGVRTAQVEMPDDVSGLTVVEKNIGFFVVSNKDHHFLRRRFSYAHEYCHVLVDREAGGVVSRTSERDELIEVRANSFAACFLMSEEGVEKFIVSLGKGREKRASATVFNGAESSNIQARTAAGSQDIQLYDVAQLAHHFGVSRLAALYRLKNLRLVTESQFDVLKAQDDEKGREVAASLGLPEPDHQEARSEFKRRFLGLGLESYRRDRISRAKLLKVVKMVGVSKKELEGILENAGLDNDEDGVSVRLPGD